MQEQASSFLDKLKGMGSAFLDKMHLTKHKLFDFAIAMGIGFAVGFFLKRYAHYVCAFIIFTILIVVLQKFELLHVYINHPKVEEVFGIQATHISGDAISIFWEWVKLNGSLSISFVIGLLIGLKF
ncbi:MAG: hypothetical protein M1114_04805 [Candidatus Dependentiae bacterium]|nr:hypothetical protein [Candidatus Dependentiae bacterium]